MTGILVAAGIMDAKEEHDKSQSTTQTKSESTSKCEKGACPPCSPPAGVKFNFKTHTTHDHGNCLGRTGSQVHWHYSVNNQRPYPDCTCFITKHAFGGCGPAPVS